MKTVFFKQQILLRTPYHHKPWRPGEKSKYNLNKATIQYPKPILEQQTKQRTRRSTSWTTQQMGTTNTPLTPTKKRKTHQNNYPSIRLRQTHTNRQPRAPPSNPKTVLKKNPAQQSQLPTYQSNLPYTNSIHRTYMVMLSIYSSSASIRALWFPPPLHQPQNLDSWKSSYFSHSKSPKQ